MATITSARFLVGNPRHQLSHAQLLQSHPVDGAERALQDVIAARELSCPARWPQRPGRLPPRTRNATPASGLGTTAHSSPCSEMLKQRGQYDTFALASEMARARRLAYSAGDFNRKNANPLSRLRPDAGQPSELIDELLNGCRVAHGASPSASSSNLRSRKEPGELLLHVLDRLRALRGLADLGGFGARRRRPARRRNPKTNDPRTGGGPPATTNPKTTTTCGSGPVGADEDPAIRAFHSRSRSLRTVPTRATLRQHLLGLGDHEILAESEMTLRQGHHLLGRLRLQRVRGRLSAGRGGSSPIRRRPGLGPGSRARRGSSPNGGPAGRLRPRGGPRACLAMAGPPRDFGPPVPSSPAPPPMPRHRRNRRRRAGRSRRAGSRRACEAPDLGLKLIHTPSQRVQSAG